MTDEQIQTDETDGTSLPPTHAHGQPTADEMPDEQADADQTDVDQPDADQIDADKPDVDPLEDAELRATEAGHSAGSLLLALEASTSERDEYLDGLLRSRAEFDNFRRRTAKEGAAARQAGVGDLATRLLDVLDDLDRTATVAEASNDAGLAGGVQAVHRKLVEALVSAGIQRVDAPDVPFDATRHEAVQQVPAEEPLDAPEVAQVLRPGYLLGERVLRAAMVVVRQ